MYVLHLQGQGMRDLDEENTDLLLCFSNCLPVDMA
jgi:hypothetical protein